MNGSWGDKAVRRVAVALALALAAGGMLSVSDGLARVLGAVAGYADFGYVPAKCGSSTRTTQTLDGGTLRVCQTDYSDTYAFFAGHRGAPLWYSEAELTLQLPAQGVTLRPFGGFAPATLDPVVPGNPVMGVSRTNAGGVTVTKTASVAQGASTYTLTYTLANTSGAPLQLRPLVTLNGFGYETAPPGSSGSPRTITLRDTTRGGAVSLSEAGGEPIAGYTAGGWSRIDALTNPSAPPLDSQLHPEDGPYQVAALAWPLTTLAAAGTRTFSVTIALAQPREVLLKLRGVAPTATAPVTIDATVSEDRSLAAGQLRWGGKGIGESGVPVDNGGRASFTLPAAAGSRWVYAYFDANRNGELDLDEASAYGTIWAPGGGPQPPPIPVNPLPQVPVQPPLAPQRGGRGPITALKLPFKKVFRVKGCHGKVTVQLKLGKKVLSKRSVKLDKRCRVNTTFTVNPAVVGARTLTVVVKQGRKQKSFSLKVPRVR